jgi:hypothetical protein
VTYPTKRLKLRICRVRSSQLPERRSKGEKDLRQAVYVAKYALTDRAESGRLVRLWQGLPRKWKARVRKALDEAWNAMPLEQRIVQRMREVLS